MKRNQSLKMKESNLLIATSLHASIKNTYPEPITLTT